VDLGRGRRLADLQAKMNYRMVGKVVVRKLNVTRGGPGTEIVRHGGEIGVCGFSSELV